MTHSSLKCLFFPVVGAAGATRKLDFIGLKTFVPEFRRELPKNLAFWPPLLSFLSATLAAAAVSFADLVLLAVVPNVPPKVLFVFGASGRLHDMTLVAPKINATLGGKLRNPQLKG